MKRHATSAWLDNAGLVLGGPVYLPRGMATREVIGHKTVIDMNYPIVELEGRKMGTKFMAAEAAWILSGDSKVSTISPYSGTIGNFSDDGVRFNGAYGPMVIEQLTYVVDSLHSDQSSRQAVMTIWRQNPRPSKDIPCTVALQFLIRDNAIQCIVFMRSNDLWLGFPYDIFSFTMIATAVQLELAKRGKYYDLGMMTHIAGSLHLYERDFEDVSRVLSMNHAGTFKPIKASTHILGSISSTEELAARLRLAADEGGLQTWLNYRGS